MMKTKLMVRKKRSVEVVRVTFREGEIVLIKGVRFRCSYINRGKGRISFEAAVQQRILPKYEDATASDWIDRGVKKKRLDMLRRELWLTRKERKQLGVAAQRFALLTAHANEVLRLIVATENGGL